MLATGRMEQPTCDSRPPGNGNDPMERYKTHSNLLNFHKKIQIELN